MTKNRLHQVQQDLHSHEKTHRYSNEEYFEREQRIKTIENELKTLHLSHEKLQKDHHIINEELDKYRYRLEEVEKSDIFHKERVS